MLHAPRMTDFDDDELDLSEDDSDFDDDEPLELDDADSDGI